TPGAPGGATPAQQGTELVVHNLTDGKERTFADVTEYTLSKDGKWLVYAVAGKEQTGGVYAATLGRETPPLVIRSGPGRYSRLTWDEKQTQLVFFHRQTPTPSPSGAT